MSAVTKIISKTPVVGAIAKEIGIVPKKKKAAAAKTAEPKMASTTDAGAEQQALMASRRRRGRGLRSLLSPTREDAQTGLSNKLGG